MALCRARALRAAKHADALALELAHVRCTSLLHPEPAGAVDHVRAQHHIHHGSDRRRDGGS